MSRPILIVGAGPVGLTAALVLAKQQVPVRIIDQLPHRINQSRAAIIHARTLELFERLGVIDRFLAAGIRAHGVHVMDRDGTTLIRPSLDDLPTAYPYLLGLGQDQTERILTEELERIGIAIERPVILTGFTQTDESVSATIQHDDGRTETVEVAYLVGCDGSRSTVRHTLNLPMEGETLDVYWATADVRMDSDYPRDELVAIPASEGFGFASPLPDGRWRVVVDMGPKPAELPTTIPLAEVQAACDRVGLRGKLSDPTWISPFGVNTRMAPKLQVGRVFIAGDAAHVHSPVGGQGMNTGIQDAINLGWKLALAARGQATQLLVDSYDIERHANAKRLLGFVGPATKMVNLRNLIALHLRRLVMKAVSTLGLTAIAARRASELDVHCRHSPVVGEDYPGPGSWIAAVVHGEPHPDLYDCWDFGKGPHPGERAADAHELVEAGSPPRRLFEDWIGDLRHQLLVFSGRTPKPERVVSLAHEAAAIEAKSAGRIRARLIHPADVPGAAGSLLDCDGEAHQHYGARYECAYLIRPDGYVGFRCQPFDASALAAYLKTIFSEV